MMFHVENLSRPIVQVYIIFQAVCYKAGGAED